MRAHNATTAAANDRRLHRAPPAADVVLFRSPPAFYIEHHSDRPQALHTTLCCLEHADGFRLRNHIHLKIFGRFVRRANTTEKMRLRLTADR